MCIPKIVKVEKIKIGECNVMQLTLDNDDINVLHLFNKDTHLFFNRNDKMYFVKYIPDNEIMPKEIKDLFYQGVIYYIDQLN